MDDDGERRARIRRQVREVRAFLLETPEWQANPIWVYAIRVGDYGGDIKIGVSRDPAARLRNLQTSNAQQLAIVGAWPAFPEEEKLLHAQYADDRLRGEWFMHSPPLWRLISDFDFRSPLPSLHGRRA